MSCGGAMHLPPSLPCHSQKQKSNGIQSFSRARLRVCKLHSDQYVTKNKIRGHEGIFSAAQEARVRTPSSMPKNYIINRHKKVCFSWPSQPPPIVANARNTE